MKYYLSLFHVNTIKKQQTSIVVSETCLPLWHYKKIKQTAKGYINLITMGTVVDVGMNA